MSERVKGILAWVLYGFGCFIHPLYEKPMLWSAKLQGDSEYGPWETADDKVGNTKG